MKTRTRSLRRLSVAACAVPLLLTGVAAGTAAAAAPAAAPQSAPATLRAISAGEILTLVNAERAKVPNCPALVANAQLTQAAQTHADDMAKNNLTGHTGSDGSNETARLDKVGYKWGAWGENVSGPGYADAAATVNGWMTSSSGIHKANILNCNFTETGVGVSGDRAVQVFAKPL
ncbi:CAP domain-containing protein [Streptomyces sp. NBC_01006]|uniref:CAP domain-containing protein n=1 Tax=Streptomyces sp. NBC_01006 TaxID=2903716 RepID=UPI00386F5009|nr:CAP domain-containing protein [Streptomyces sp. NBC_01006]